ncbi:hypothetical protein GCM10027063_07800 [Promicromonospora xylanilytica]
MAEPTVQQQPVGRRLGLLVRAGVLSLHVDLAVMDDDGAAAALERILDVLRPCDRVYVVGAPAPAEQRLDDRPFTIWA